ncbi:MAG: hypothetical protein JWR15_1067 [Prosthecobacter sp.]|nr:hypothetical protein [Prosthecobacter sp.]
MRVSFDMEGKNRSREQARVSAIVSAPIHVVLRIDSWSMVEHPDGFGLVVHFAKAGGC